MPIQLKQPSDSYEPRLMRFLRMIIRVRRLMPRDLHMWKVMDSVAFEDTESALKTTLFNKKHEAANDSQPLPKREK